MKSGFALILLVILTSSDCANILFWLPFSFKSGMVAYMPLVEELGRRGHKVTVVASNVKEGIKDPNILQIHNGDTVAEWTKNASEFTLRGEDPPVSYFTDGFCNLNEVTFDLPEVQKAIAKDKKYDMVAVYIDITCCEAGHYLAQRFDAPLVLLSMFQNSWPFLDWAMGQPYVPALTPLSGLTFKPGEMTFMERWMNSLATVAFHWYRNSYLIGRVEGILDKHFPGEDRIPVLEMEKQASLAISFGHPHLTDGWRPTMPNFIQLGMMLCNSKAGKFDKNDKIGQFLNQAPTVYLSFGSVVKASTMPKAKVDMFLNAFEKLKPLQVLWKWESSDLDGKLPSNVMVSKWLPQQDVLAHPNVKTFVTHAGQSSFQESICHKVTMVAVPLFADQLVNAIEIEMLGIGVNLQYKTLTVNILVENVRKVLNDKSYQEKINHLSYVLLDEIDKPLDRAIWWMEHVIRHPKLYAGKAAVHKLTWAQYFLVDVIAFTALILILTPVVLYYSFVWACCRKRSKGAERKQKQN